jgi:hypothetical protein
VSESPPKRVIVDTLNPPELLKNPPELAVTAPDPGTVTAPVVSSIVTMLHWSCVEVGPS